MPVNAVPPNVPFRHVVGSGHDERVPLTGAEIEQKKQEEAAWAIEAAKPRPPTLEERIAALEAKVG